jgi:hypothetical protein
MGNSREKVDSRNRGEEGTAGIGVKRGQQE